MLRLRELRLEQEKTQLEMARFLGTSRQVYANYENGINEPSIDMLGRMADYFQCSTDYLTGRTDDLGNITIYALNARSTLSPTEQKIIDALKTSAPTNYREWLSMYSELPTYLQDSIFAELKGMYLGYKASKAGKTAKK